MACAAPSDEAPASRPGFRASIPLRESRAEPFRQGWRAALEGINVTGFCLFKKKV